MFRPVVIFRVISLLYLNVVGINQCHGVPKEGLLSGHLIIGDEARENQFPYVASIRVKSIHYCAGSIINNEWILTAAHCKFSSRIDYYSVTVGTTKLNKGGYEFGVEKFIIHPDFKEQTSSNNIALIKLSTPINTSYPIENITLPDFDIANNEYLEVSGWGFTSSPATTPNNLMYMYLMTVNPAICRESYPGLKISNGHLCTYSQKGRSICSGDSGGPLVAQGVIYGVATWLKPCSLDGKPEIFTRVYTYVDWITKVIKE